MLYYYLGKIGVYLNVEQSPRPTACTLHSAPLTWPQFPPSPDISPFYKFNMSRHAQIEEVSDSDPEEIAPSYDSDDDLPRNAIISPVNIPTKAAPQPQQQMPMPSMPSMPAPEPQREIPRHFSCLYPVYFDKSRSRAEGRKVGAELAVENPLARDIVDAVQMLGLNAGLEPEKLHPKDWANPGRVRVQVKNEDGQLANPKIKNSTWLIPLVG